MTLRMKPADTKAGKGSIVRWLLAAGAAAAVVALGWWQFGDAKPGRIDPDDARLVALGREFIRCHLELRPLFVQIALQPIRNRFASGQFSLEEVLKLRQLNGPIFNGRTLPHLGDQLGLSLSQRIPDLRQFLV